MIKNRIEFGVWLKIRSRSLGWVLLALFFNAIPLISLGMYYLQDGCMQLRRSKVCGDETKYWLIFIFLILNGFLVAIVLGAIRHKKKNSKLKTNHSKDLPQRESLSRQGQLLAQQVLDYCADHGDNWDSPAADLAKQRIISAIAEIDGRFDQKPFHIINLPNLLDINGKVIELSLAVSNSGTIRKIDIQ